MEGRQLRLGDINMKILLRDYRDAVKNKLGNFKTDCLKNGGEPLEFVTKFCYYWLQNIEMRTGLKLLTEKDYKEINNDKD